MIGFDTNVLLRALLSDDPDQSAAARTRLSALSSEQTGLVSVGVLLELYWVLDRRYRLPRSEISRTFRSLMEIEDLVFEDMPTLVRALHIFETRGADFSDALIAERNQTLGCSATLTFDENAIRRVPGMESAS